MDAAQRCGAAAVGEDVNAHGAAAAERSATEAAAACLSGARAQGCCAAPAHSQPSQPSPPLDGLVSPLGGTTHFISIFF